MLPEQRKAVRRADSMADLVERAKHEICERHASPCAGERCTARAVAADEIEIHVLPLVSPLEGVGTSNEGHRILPVPVAVHLPLRTSEVQAHLDAANTDANHHTTVTLIDVDTA